MSKQSIYRITARIRKQRNFFGLGKVKYHGIMYDIEQEQFDYVNEDAMIGVYTKWVTIHSYRDKIDAENALKALQSFEHFD